MASAVEKKADAFSALLAANEFAGQVGGVNEATALLETVKKLPFFVANGACPHRPRDRIMDGMKQVLFNAILRLT
jgi:hypothetical protein